MMRHAKAEETKGCSMSGCKDEGHKSLSTKKVEKALSTKFEGKPRRVHLCKVHYKEYKKATKKDRELERLAWD